MTFMRQDVQLGSTRDTLVGFVDNVATGATMQTGAASIADDLNNLRSQVNRAYDATAGGNWYDAVPTVNSKQRGLLQLNTGLDNVEVQPFICGVEVLTNVTVPAAQNYVVLSVASS
jgi:hypothetical protein